MFYPLQVGVLPDDGDNQTICLYRELSATGDQTRNPTEKGDMAALAAASTRIRQLAISFGGASSYTAGHSHHQSMNGSVTGGPRPPVGAAAGSFGEQHPPDILDPRSLASARSMRSERTAGSEAAPSIPQMHLDLDLEDEEPDSMPGSSFRPGLVAPSPAKAALGPSKADRTVSMLAPTVGDLTARSRTEPTASTTCETVAGVQPSPPSALRKSRAGTNNTNSQRTVRFPAGSGSQTNSSGLNESFLKKHLSGGSGLQNTSFADMSKSTKINMSAAILPSMDGSRAAQSEPGAGNLYAFDAAMLRGIRVRIGVVSGPSDMHVAVNSSGRPMYRGSALKHLQKLLKQAHTGQVLVTGKVMQQADV